MEFDGAEAFERAIEELEADRLRLLDALGLTEHEWACRGGQQFYGSLAEEFRDRLLPAEEDLAPEEPLPPSPPPPPIPVEMLKALHNPNNLPPPPPIPVEMLSPPPPPIPPLVPLSPPLQEVEPVATLTDEQSAALAAIDDWIASDSSQFFALTGPAGSGKTFLTREILRRHGCAMLTAMTGKAALRLSELAEYPASTHHSKLYWPPQPGSSAFVRLREPPYGLVICDESSMMTPSVFRDTRRWGSDFRCLVIGDSFQLPPVIVGEEAKQYGDDWSVFAQVEGVALETVMRNAGGVLRAATRVRETGEICAQSDLDAPGEGYEYVRSRSPLELAVDTYCEDRDDHLLITWTNKTRMKANAAIRARLGHDGPLPDEGEPVLIKKNGQGCLNGEIVECGTFENGPVIDSVRTMWMGVPGRVDDDGLPLKILVTVDGGRADHGGEFFDGGAPWVDSFKRYHIELQKQLLPEPTPVTWGYCVTAHAAQGSQARRTTVFLCRGEDRSSFFRKSTTLPNGQTASFCARWAYTSITRSERYTVMVVGR